MYIRLAKLACHFLYLCSHKTCQNYMYICIYTCMFRYVMYATYCNILLQREWIKQLHPTTPIPPPHAHAHTQHTHPRPHPLTQPVWNQRLGRASYDSESHFPPQHTATQPPQHNLCGINLAVVDLTTLKIIFHLNVPQLHTYTQQPTHIHPHINPQPPLPNTHAHRPTHSHTHTWAASTCQSWIVRLTITSFTWSISFTSRNSITHPHPTKPRLPPHTQTPTHLHTQPE